jgi:hypothetical protein
MTKKIEQELDLVGLGFRMKREERCALGMKVAKAPQPVTFHREQENKYDVNAIAVYRGKEKLGYLRRETAEKLAPLIDDKEIKLSGKLIELLASDDNKTGVMFVIIERKETR